MPAWTSLPSLRRPASLLRWITQAGAAAGLALALALAPGGNAAAQPPGVQIGFCPGPPGPVTVTVEVVVRCPAQTTLSATIVAPCDDAAAVMTAVDGAMAGFVWPGGGAIFGPPVVVGGGVSGQTRHEYLLTPGFLASNCIIQSVNIDFDCGTMGLVVRVPAVPGGPVVPGPTKLGFFGPPPGPSTLVVKFEGCPAISVPLDGTETADQARDKVLAALLAAGYSASIGTDGRIVVDADCSGTYPAGTDELGLSGGSPMHLGIGSCPPPGPVGVSERTWGTLKNLYR
jgi:hypothetical protein